MVERLWQTLLSEKTPRSPERVGSSEQHLVLGRDVVGRHVLLRDLVVVPGQDGRAFIRPAQPSDFSEPTPLLLICPDSIEEIAPYLDLSPVLSVPLQEQEEKTIDLQDLYPEVHAELKVDLYCAVSDGKCYCGTAKKSISETGEWYIMVEGQIVPLRRGFALQYIDNQVVLSKVSVTKTQHQPTQQNIAQEILRSQITEEIRAVASREYQPRQSVFRPSAHHDFTEITQMSTEAFVQRMIFNARRLNPGKEEEIEERLRTSIEAWRKNRELIDRSDVLIIFEFSGIGDAPYQFVAASVLAKQYPEKRIIFISNSAVTPLFFTQHENMEVVQSVYQLEDMPDHTKEVALLSLNYSNEMPDEETKKTTEYLQSLIGQNSSPAQDHEVSHQVPSLEGPHIHNLFELHESVLWRMFGKFFASSDHKLHESLSLLYDGDLEHYRDVIDQYHVQRPSQLEEYAGIMTHLFGCQPEVVREAINTMPIKVPEQQTTERADIIFIYDAKSGYADSDKVLIPDQLIQAIKQLEQRFPDRTIGIVIGNTHPDLARFVLHACPKLVPIEGSFEQVLGTCVDAEVVVSVDTGFLHMLNFYKRDAALSLSGKSEQLGASLPQLVGIFGLDMLFPLRRFLPTQAEQVIVSERQAKDVSAAKIADVVTTLVEQR